jgi:RNA polymerase sigma-70 factor (ECF subfamily)
MNMQERTQESAITEEHVLIAQAKSGHANAFGELYERHRLRIYHTAFRILRNRQDAEDAVQQSFQRAFTKLSGFREDSTFSTWVTRIAINEALMMLRQQRVTTPLFDPNNDDVNATSVLDLVDEGPTPEQALAENEDRAAVTYAVSRLRQSLRVVAQLRELQGLSNAETARRLGLTVAAVKARTFHARRNLRQHFESKSKVGLRDFSVGLESKASEVTAMKAKDEARERGNPTYLFRKKTKDICCYRTVNVTNIVGGDHRKIGHQSLSGGSEIHAGSREKSIPSSHCALSHCRSARRESVLSSSDQGICTGGAKSIVMAHCD